MDFRNGLHRRQPCHRTSKFPWGTSGVVRQPRPAEVSRRPGGVARQPRPASVWQPAQPPPCVWCRAAFPNRNLCGLAGDWRFGAGAVFPNWRLCWNSSRRLAQPNFLDELTVAGCAAWLQGRACTCQEGWSSPILLTGERWLAAARLAGKGLNSSRRLAQPNVLDELAVAGCAAWLPGRTCILQ